MQFSLVFDLYKCPCNFMLLLRELNSEVIVILFTEVSEPLVSRIVQQHTRNTETSSAYDHFNNNKKISCY
jgi:hypothetical protein